MNAPIPAHVFKTALPRPGIVHLRHLPGEDGLTHLPYYDTVRFLTDPLAQTRRSYARYGPVFRVNQFGGWSAVLIGPEANELVLFDRERNFSSAGGWGPILHRLFPRGLMLLDFEEHRQHRRALGIAFKPEVMRAYCDALNEGIARRVAEWGAAGGVKIYPAVKQLTLDLAATAFLGLPWGPESARINKAFVDMVQAAVGVVRGPVPGTKMARGVKGRLYVSALFGREIAGRRGSDAPDMFTHLCNATGEDGALLTEDAIVKHMVFMMMAAHDTLTSSLTMMVHHLARNPDWQERIAAEASAVAAPQLEPDRLGDLPLTDMVFKESLRLNPPVPSVPRRAIRAFEFMGHHIPAGTHIGINPMLTHRLPEHWPDPDRFDPLRFTPDAVAKRHKYAWVPYGGGAHMCIGLHYATMQAKVFAFHLLRGWRVTAAGPEPKFQLFPMPKPRDGLPVRLAAR